MRIEYLYRYPVKGLTAEALEWAEVAPGGCIPWDRAFALAQGDSEFDPEKPEWRQKSNFMCLKENARIAALRSSFDPRSGLLAIRAPGGIGVSANVLYPEGRGKISAFLIEYLGAEVRGRPEFHFVPGHSFCDQRSQVVSLISLESLADYEAKAGGRRHRRRFRSNIWFSGAPPWAEFDWVGREIQVGGATLRVTKRTVRCPATEVNPETATRDINPVAELRALYGHADLGIHAEVIVGGKFTARDSIELMPA